jgi:hypothetical protein
MSGAELTLFKKTDGPLTKKIALDGNGGVVTDASGCFMTCGAAMRAEIADVGALGALIRDMRSEHALALGSLRADLPRQVHIITKNAINGAAPPGTIARTKANLIYRNGARGFVLLDFDAKGMPGAAAERMTTLGGFIPAIVAVIPQVSRAARLVRASTSAGLYREDTRQVFAGSCGLHVYVAVSDVSDSERFLRVLHERCWLHGLGWFMVGVAGQLLERSIVDRMVGTPERLVFEGPPVLVPPLAQDQAAREPRTTEGDWLNAATSCPLLDAAERSRLGELHAKAAVGLEREVAAARNRFLDEQAKAIAARTGVTTFQAREIAIKQSKGVLLPSVMLAFDDPVLGGKTVADVLADPGAYEGETLADPLEGVSYGRCKAKVMRGGDGIPWINSYAHGHAAYQLKHDAAAVRVILLSVPQGECVKTLVHHILTADLDEGEIGELIALASRQTGTGIREINRMLKAARKAQAAAWVELEQKRRKAARTDPRPIANAPPRDAPWLPEMNVYDGILSGAATDGIPPSRYLEDEIDVARRAALPALHAFSAANE